MRPIRVFWNPSNIPSRRDKKVSFTKCKYETWSTIRVFRRRDNWSDKWKYYHLWSVKTPTRVGFPNSVGIMIWARVHKGVVKFLADCFLLYEFDPSSCENPSNRTRIEDFQKCLDNRIQFLRIRQFKSEILWIIPYYVIKLMLQVGACGAFPGHSFCKNVIIHHPNPYTFLEILNLKSCGASSEPYGRHWSSG